MKRDDDGGFYHSKQRQLMRMEVQHAFEIRSAVVVVLGLLRLEAVWTGWIGFVRKLRGTKHLNPLTNLSG